MMDRVNREDPGGSVIGRYALYGPIARGGMATVFFGRLRGPAGFTRTVAIKRLHPQFAAQPEFVSMFVDEARLASRIRSPHVVPTLDVVATGEELFLVMDYVAGESLARLVRAAADRGERIPLPVTVAILSGALQGLHAAHEARDEAGEPLGIVHRDVSPQNILVGTDGLARVLDFGVAKAAGRLQSTRDGELKGKLSYMPPEQLRHEPLTRRGDVYSASVVLWETLTGERLFGGEDEGAVVTRVLIGKVEPPSLVLARGKHPLTEEELGVFERLDALLLRGTDRDPTRRFATAGEMAIALEESAPPATPREVSEWVTRAVGSILAERAARVAEIESGRVAAEVVALERGPSGASAGGGHEAQAPGVAPASNPRPAAAARRARWARLAGGAAAAALCAGLALLFRLRDSPPPLVGTAVALPSAAASAQAPEVSAPPALLDASPSPATAPPPSAAPRSPSNAPKRTRPAADCTPPFSWDAQGKKHYKAQCL
jgi:hypothetical protein